MFNSVQSFGPELRARASRQIFAPDLRERLASVAGAVWNAEGNPGEADAAGERLAGEVRLWGREAMRSWADERVVATERAVRLQAGMHRQGKKIQCHTTFGEILVPGPQYRFGNTRVRPFVQGAKISPRGCSRSLRRAIVDCAADQPFPVKEALKTGHLDAVLRSIIAHCEPAATSDDQAPVRACHRSLSGRANRLKYREALAEGLPAGAGEIESAHRYVAQTRLQRPGAWWRAGHARHMRALCGNRLNGDWTDYWAALAATPPAPANRNRPKVSPDIAA